MLYAEQAHDIEQDRDHHHEANHHAILLAEVSVGTLPHVTCDFLHAFIAGILSNHPAVKSISGGERGQRANWGQPPDNRDPDPRSDPIRRFLGGCQCRQNSHDKND
jgi:hypothetical protein